MDDFLKSLKLGVVSASFFLAASANAASMFSDGFESGSLNHTDGGVSYGDSESTSVSNSLAKSGTYSLRFRYAGVASGQDSFAEQRISYSNAEELWIKYDLYIPSNYTHRDESGPDNNKFLAIYRNPYGNPGFQVNWSLTPNGSGGSNLRMHRYRNGSEQPIITPDGGIGNNIIATSDRGNWIQIIARIKVPSASNSNDGVMQMWKGTESGEEWSYTQVTNETELDNFGGNGENYMSELYLLGWSNSGYAEETIFYIDNLEINNAPFYIPKNPTDPVSN